jgi:hypothetical protein
LQNSNFNDSWKCSCKYYCITTDITTTTTTTSTISTNKYIKSLNNFLCGESFIERKLFEKYNNSIQSILNFVVLTRQLEGPISEQHVSEYKQYNK